MITRSERRGSVKAQTTTSDVLAKESSKQLHSNRLPSSPSPARSSASTSSSSSAETNNIRGKRVAPSRSIRVSSSSQEANSSDISDDFQKSSRNKSADEPTALAITTQKVAADDASAPAPIRRSKRAAAALASAVLASDERLDGILQKLLAQARNDQEAKEILQNWRDPGLRRALLQKHQTADILSSSSEPKRYPLRGRKGVDKSENDQDSASDANESLQSIDSAEERSKPLISKSKPRLGNALKAGSSRRQGLSVPLPRRQTVKERMKNREVSSLTRSLGRSSASFLPPTKSRKRKAVRDQSDVNRSRRPKRKRVGRSSRNALVEVEDEDDDEVLDEGAGGSSNDDIFNFVIDADEEVEYEAHDDEEHAASEGEGSSDSEIDKQEHFEGGMIASDSDESSEEEEEEEIKEVKKVRQGPKRRSEKATKKSLRRRKRTEPLDVFDAKRDELSAKEQKERLEYLVSETAKIASALHQTLAESGLASDNDGTKANGGSLSNTSPKKTKRKEEVFAPPIGRGCELQEHQKEGVKWLLTLDAQGLNAILADEMGLGKTVQAAAFLASLVLSGSRGPHLVIAPKNVCKHWVDEIERWYPGQLTVASHLGPAEERLSRLDDTLAEDNFDIVVTSFEIALRDLFTKKRIEGLPSYCTSVPRRFRKVEFEYLVVDEAHRLKNDNSQMNKAIRGYQQARRRLLLTGTPLSNNLRELWSLMNILNPNIFNSKATFESWFSAPFERVKGKKRAAMTHAEKSVIVDRLHTIIRPFFRRRERKDVCPTFTSADEVIVQCPMSMLQKALMYHYQRRATERDAGVSNILMAMREVSNHPYTLTDAFDEGDDDDFATPKLVALSGKFSFLHYAVPRLIASGHRILIFSQFRSVLDFLENLMELLDIKFGRLDGMTDSDERIINIEEFNAEGSDIPVFLLTTRAGGVGLNLQTADTVILFDSDWNPSADLQAVSRIQRIGQKKMVHIIRLVTENSIDALIVETAEHKRKTQAVAVGAGKFNTSQGATRDQHTRQKDLEQLMMRLESKNFLDDLTDPDAGEPGSESSPRSSVEDKARVIHEARKAEWNRKLLREGEVEIKSVDIQPIWIDSTSDTGVASIPKWLERDADLVAASRAIICLDRVKALQSYYDTIESRARVGSFSKADRAKRACRNMLLDFSDLDIDSEEEKDDEVMSRKSDDSVHIEDGSSDSDISIEVVSDDSALQEKRSKHSKVHKWTTACRIGNFSNGIATEGRPANNEDNKVDTIKKNDPNIPSAVNPGHADKAISEMRCFPEKASPFSVRPDKTIPLQRKKRIHVVDDDIDHVERTDAIQIDSDEKVAEMNTAPQPGLKAGDNCLNADSFRRMNQVAKFADKVPEPMSLSQSDERPVKSKQNVSLSQHHARLPSLLAQAASTQSHTPSSSKPSKPARWIKLPLMEASGKVDIMKIEVPLDGPHYERILEMSSEAMNSAKLGDRKLTFTLCSNIANLLRGYEAQSPFQSNPNALRTSMGSKESEVLVTSPTQGVLTAKTASGLSRTQIFPPKNSIHSIQNGGPSSVIPNAPPSFASRGSTKQTRFRVEAAVPGNTGASECTVPPVVHHRASANLAPLASSKAFGLARQPLVVPPVPPAPAVGAQLQVSGYAPGPLNNTANNTSKVLHNYSIPNVNTSSGVVRVTESLKDASQPNSRSMLPEKQTLLGENSAKRNTSTGQKAYSQHLAELEEVIDVDSFVPDLSILTGAKFELPRESYSAPANTGTECKVHDNLPKVKSHTQMAKERVVSKALQASPASAHKYNSVGEASDSRPTTHCPSLPNRVISPPAVSSFVNSVATETRAMPTSQVLKSIRGVKVAGKVGALPIEPSIPTAIETTENNRASGLVNEKQSHDTTLLGPLDRAAPPPMSLMGKFVHDRNPLNQLSISEEDVLSGGTGWSEKSEETCSRKSAPIANPLTVQKVTPLRNLSLKLTPIANPIAEKIAENRLIVSVNSQDQVEDKVLGQHSMTTKKCTPERMLSIHPKASEGRTVDKHMEKLESPGNIRSSFTPSQADMSSAILNGGTKPRLSFGKRAVIRPVLPAVPVRPKRPASPVLSSEPLSAMTNSKTPLKTVTSHQPVVPIISKIAAPTIDVQQKGTMLSTNLFKLNSRVTGKQVGASQGVATESVPFISNGSPEGNSECTVSDSELEALGKKVIPKELSLMKMEPEQSANKVTEGTGQTQQACRNEGLSIIHGVASCNICPKSGSNANAVNVTHVRTLYNGLSEQDKRTGSMELICKECVCEFAKSLISADGLRRANLKESLLVDAVNQLHCNCCRDNTKI